VTDSIHSFQVVLEHNIREDDIVGIVGALKHVKGVLNVVPVKSTFDSVMAEERVRIEYKNKFLELLRDL
jgi:hypothetical protein